MNLKVNIIKEELFILLEEVVCKKRKQAGGYDWKLISDAGHKNIKEDK